MSLPFLFLSGEFRVSLPLTVLRDKWQHTTKPDELILVDSTHIRRRKYVNEKLNGVIFYADVADKELEKSNLELLQYNCIPCWPPPVVLLNMLDRHSVLKQCIDAELVDHPVFQITTKELVLPFPFVIKVGNTHRGEGKYYISTADDLLKLDHDGSTITYEPFFKGTSVRILLIDDNVFGIKIDNPNSWIANSYGAETSSFTPDIKLVRHAQSVAKIFNLDFAGVDYIIDNENKFHFLEINQYPGLDISDEAEPVIKQALNNKLDLVEKWARNNPI